MSGYRGSDIGYWVKEESKAYAAGSVSSYRDLRVWEEAIELTDGVYRVSRQFPSDERFGLTAQIRRAAVSVPSNIAEGWGRGATNEYVQFLRYARPSLYEVETQLVIAERNGYLRPEELATLLDRSEAVGRMVLGLIRSLRRL